MLLAALQILLLGVTGFLLSYLAFLSVLACRARQEAASLAASGERRFAVVIPAYNEEKNITRTIRDLSNVIYDPSKFSIIVIADNCTDRTAEIAEREGAAVMVRTNPHQRGKGYALRWCFDELTKNKNMPRYDAVIVIDADTIVFPNILRVMNTYMEKGAEVVQGYLKVDSKPGIWTSEIIRIGFTLNDYVRPLARGAMGCSAGLRGNGMCFSTGVLKGVPWNAYSLAEDLEYGIELLLNNIPVVFAPETIGLNVVPENAKNAESQRERWEMGRIPILKIYSRKLLRAAIRHRSLKIFDALIDLVTPPLVNIMVFAMMMAGGSLLLWWSGIQASLLYTGFWLGLLGLGLFHALVGLYAARADWSLYRSLFYVPRYTLWKIYIYFKILLVKGRTTEWVRTSRESS